MNTSQVESFPLWALLPKRETTATSFLTKYPTYDGRGVKIAILDSGVDPGADGLQTTSEGKPKIIDMMDASGAGDVDTSTVVEPDNEGFIKGLTGIKLKIPSSWTNPSAKYHIGVKNIYELYPKSLKERISKEYIENEWQPMHKTVTAEAVRELQEFQNSHSDASADNIDQKLIREELQSKVDFLKGLEKKFIDLGPTYDCVVFHDGYNWRGVIDTSGIGNLEECTLLGNYSECLKYGTISQRDMLNYSINIHNEGNLLEIVSMSSAHGTHVASIASAYFPNEPEKNGVSPGAQIISIAIGDNRLGSMETGTALIRAFVKVIESGCDVINMSYGEHGHYAEGRVLELLHEVVNKYGIVYVSSAGNHGPALSTIGTPPTMQSSSIIGVGAYVSPDMMTVEYSMRSKLPAMGYSWTSRGPTLNGDLGVSICGPGGAITSVPNWTLRKAQLMNGTSMSSPNVAGCVALLLSGLKAQNISYSPYSIRRSLQNTALKVPNYDPFTHGHGLIQVEKAFENLVQFKDSIERDIRFHISTGDKLGVYLRQTHSVINSSLHPITIEPIYLNDKLTDTKKKVEFEMNLSITCDDQWVTCPTFLNMSYSSRSFVIKVDPQGLESGSVNFSMIRAFDVKCVEKGPVFQIPITVIKPTKMSETKKFENTETYKPGYFRRQFIEIPNDVTSASFKVKNCNTEETGSFVLHTMQVQPQSSCKTNEFFKYFTLAPQAENNYNIQLTRDRTLEICFGKWWSSIGETQVSFSIEFYGLYPSLNSITMNASECVKRIDMNSTFKFEETSPNLTLKNFVQPLRPIENKVRPLYKKRDVIPPGRQIYEIMLTYSFQLTKANEIVISCPLLSDLLYESEYESQLWMLFDVNKQLLMTGDAYPSKYSVKLEKGDYTIRLQIRHETVSLLEKLSELPIHIQYKLAANVSLNLYETHRNALIDGKKFNSKTLKPHTQCPIYISSITELPKNLPILNGSYFSGNISFTKDDNRKKVEIFDFKYIIDSEQQKKNLQKETKLTETNEKPLDEQFVEALNELKITWLSKLTGKSADNLFSELQNAHNNNTQFILSRIQSLDADAERDKHLKTQISLANELLDLIKVNELLASFAVLKIEKKETPNQNSTNTANNNLLKNLEKQKTSVLEALIKKGIAICDLIEIQNKEKINDFATVQTSNNEVSVVEESDERKLSPTVQQSLSDADQVFSEITKLIDPYDSKVVKFTEKHALIHSHFGRALKLFVKLQETKPTLENELKSIEALKQLNWNHCVSAYNRSINVKFPKSFRLF